jgi:hypothetical protein
MASYQFENGPDNDPDPISDQLTLYLFNNAFKMAACSPKIVKSQLADNFLPCDLSVICGRGSTSYNHPGNRRFRALFHFFVEDYYKAVKAGKKVVKSAIVSIIVAMVRDSGGCFCKLEEGKWFEVGEYYAREKVSAVFREMLHAQDRPSANAEIVRRNVRGIRLPNDASMSSSPYSGSKTDVSTVFRGIVHGPQDLSFATAEIGFPKCPGSTTDSLGFDHLLDVDFFDVDGVF